MNILLHNRVEISNGKQTIVKHNKMLPTVFSRLSALQPYNEFLALGNGTNNSPETDSMLAAFVGCYELECENLQNDVEKGDLYIKKTAVIYDDGLDNLLLTEAGLCDNSSVSPTIFNYFSLTDTGDGIAKIPGSPLVISIYIFLTISPQSEASGKLTAGPNKFVSFLLGNGLDDKIYACRGKTLIGNSGSVRRERVPGFNFTECSLDFRQVGSVMNLTITGELQRGELYEAILLIGSEPFARISTLCKEWTSEFSDTFFADDLGTVTLGENFTGQISVTDNDSGESVTNFVPVRYALSPGDELFVPLNNLFDRDTPRFVSKDGKMIIFVRYDKLYCYRCEDFKLTEVESAQVTTQNIVNVISFDNFVFVVSKSSPYISAYAIMNNEFIRCNFDYGTFDNLTLFSRMLKFDIVRSRDNRFMFSVLEERTGWGYVLYFDFDSELRKFIYRDLAQTEQIKYDLMVSMTSDSYTDAFTLFVKGGKTPTDCKQEFIYPDKSSNTEFSTLAWYLTEDTGSVYCSGRAIVAEQLSTGQIWLYLFPNGGRVNLSLSSGNVGTVLAPGLRFMAEKLDDGTVVYYFLVCNCSPVRFTGAFPREFMPYSILDIEFLGDMILLFTDDPDKKIVAFSLFENKLMLENLPQNSSGYTVSCSKFQVPGTDKNVSANFSLKVVI